MTDRSKPRVNLAGILPDGTRYRFRTAAGYSYAAAVQRGSQWEVLTRGWSACSVLSRARTRAPSGARIEVIPLREDWPSLIDEYFARYEPGFRSRPVISDSFCSGWYGSSWGHPSVSQLRKLQGMGYTAVAITWEGRTADFGLDELLRRHSR